MSFQKAFSLALIAFLAFMFYLPSVDCQCCRNPIIFNFGDSNSDTGGYAAAWGNNMGYPYGRAFFPEPTGRACDGRLIVDFLCESLKTKYLAPFLDSLQPDFSNGVNFAIAGASTLPINNPFNLNLQILEFSRFHNRSLQLHTKGHKNMLGEHDFENALYTIDIGQNNLDYEFRNHTYDQVVPKIPSYISQIRDAMLAIYRLGGKNFWVHNTAPLGCFPSKLAAMKPNATQVDQSGCIKSMNEGAKAFNSKLNALCEELRVEMKNSTIVYVDIYSIKYNLVANSSSYGFKNPLMACCKYGMACCEEGSSPYISWDGIHYTEAANAIVASKILSTNYSTPSLGFNFFCNNA